MQNINLVESFTSFKEVKNINREVLMNILSDVLKHTLLKKFETIDNYDIIVNVDRGDLEIWRNRLIVEDGMSEDDNIEIEYSEAIKIEPDFEVGEEITEEIKITDFSRREILSIRQNLASKILEYENGSIYRKYSSRIGEIVEAEIYQVFKNEVLLLDDDNVEISLPKSEQIPSEFYKKGFIISGVISEVKIKNNKPIVIMSRISPLFLEKLLENEVPEIYDGIITIKNIVRDPGIKSKISVESYDDDRSDPIGIVVGQRGYHIKNIMNKINNENIDVIKYTNNTELYITRCLNPAKISLIEIDEDNKRASVYMNPDQFKLAIGKNRSNIRLTSQLTGYDIDIYSEISEDAFEDDVDINEFSNEIDQEIIDIFISIGCDTAKRILSLDKTDICNRTGLTEEKTEDILKILKSEFE